MVFVREHHAFGRNVVVGTAQIPLQDYVDKDEIITVPVEGGSSHHTLEVYVCFMRLKIILR